MKSTSVILLIAAMFACQTLSAQSYKANTYTDVLGNHIREYRDSYGRIVRTETATRDVLGNTVVTVRDQHGRQIEQITYETNIVGDTIITIRDANNAFVEQIIYSRDIFGRTETTIINSYGCKIEYKKSHYYLNGRRYGHYNRYFNEHRRPHKLDNQPHHKRHNIHKEHPRHQLQRPGQKKFHTHKHTRPSTNHQKRESSPRR